MSMRTVHRPRRYLAPLWIFLLRPCLRYSPSRTAYVLRLVGTRRGPVLRVDRRRGVSPFQGVERRRARIA
jgi:hypothetical protein